MAAVITPKRFTPEEYHRLGAAGFFAPGERVELIRGEILPMSPKGTKHAVCCNNLLPALLQAIGDRAILRCQDPIALPGGSEPEPDVAIARRRDDRYLTGHPTPADLWLVIEVADTSLAYDRDVKTVLYAEAGIPHYWLFDLVENRLEAYSEPTANFYAQRRIVLRDRAIALPELPEAMLDLGTIFP